MRGGGGREMEKQNRRDSDSDSDSGCVPCDISTYSAGGVLGVSPAIVGCKPCSHLKPHTSYLELPKPPSAPVLSRRCSSSARLGKESEAMRRKEEQKERAQKEAARRVREEVTHHR